MKIKQIMPAENYWVKCEDEKKEGSFFYHKIVAFALIWDPKIKNSELAYSMVPMHHFGDFEFDAMDVEERKDIEIIFSKKDLGEFVF